MPRKCSVRRARENNKKSIFGAHPGELPQTVTRTWWKRKKDKIRKGEIVIYQSKDNKIQLKVKLEQETVWLTQVQIAELFKTDRTVITKHLNNIFNSKELDKKSVCAKIAHTARDGKIYQTMFYNLDVVISVGIGSRNTMISKHAKSLIAKKRWGF